MANRCVQYSLELTVPRAHIELGPLPLVELFCGSDERCGRATFDLASLERTLGEEVIEEVDLFCQDRGGVCATLLCSLRLVELRGHGKISPPKQIAIGGESCIVEVIAIGCRGLEARDAGRLKQPHVAFDLGLSVDYRALKHTAPSCSPSPEAPTYLEVIRLLEHFPRDPRMTSALTVRVIDGVQVGQSAMLLDGKLPWAEEGSTHHGKPVGLKLGQFWIEQLDASLEAINLLSGYGGGSAEFGDAVIRAGRGQRLSGSGAAAGSVLGMTASDSVKASRPEDAASAHRPSLLRKFFFWCANARQEAGAGAAQQHADIEAGEERIAATGGTIGSIVGPSRAPGKEVAMDRRRHAVTFEHSKLPEHGLHSKGGSHLSRGSTVTAKEEDLDFLPSFMDGRRYLKSELEHNASAVFPLSERICDVFVLRRGELGEHFGGGSRSECGRFKCLVRVVSEQDYNVGGHEQTIAIVERLRMLQFSRPVVVRLYLLRILNLLPLDVGGGADPYVIARLGSQTRGDRSKRVSNVTHADLHECYEFDVQMPGDSLLHIDVFDFSLLDGALSALRAKLDG